MSASDEELYEIAAREVASRTPIPGLWAKAFTEANGDEKATMVAYIRHRVGQMEDERQQEHKEARKVLKQRQLDARLAEIERQYADHPRWWREFKLREVRDPFGSFAAMAFWVCVSGIGVGVAIAGVLYLWKFMTGN